MKGKLQSDARLLFQSSQAKAHPKKMNEREKQTEWMEKFKRISFFAKNDRRHFFLSGRFLPFPKHFPLPLPSAFETI